MEGVGKCELTWEIQLTQAPPKGTGRPLSALDPAVSRGPRHLSRGWRGAGQRAARAGRRGRRERGRTGGPRPPTAQLSLLGSAGRAGPGVQQPPLQLLARIRRARSGRNHSPGGTGEGGGAEGRPGTPPGRSPAPRPAEVPAGGGARGECSLLRSPLPPSPAGATFLKRQVALICVYLGPRLGLLTRPHSGGTEGVATDLRAHPTPFPLRSDELQVLMHPASFCNLILLA